MWFTPQTERVIVLSKILALNKSLALLLSVLLAASVGTITIEQYPRISCHDNFVKAKDSSSHVRDRSWNMTFYLNVFYLLANNKRPCWILQVPEWGDGLVYANDMFTSHCKWCGGNSRSYNISYHWSNIYPSADSSFFQSSATGCLAFLTFRLFWAASTPIICCLYRYIFFSCNNYGVK